MDNDLRDIIQFLGELKKNLDEAVPVFTKVVKQIEESPEIQTIVEISNKAKVVLPEAIQRFADFSAPYAELVQHFNTNVAPFLMEIAHISLPFSVIHRLGEVQYVDWKIFPDSFYEQAAATHTGRELLDVVLNWLEISEFTTVNDTITALSETVQFKDNPVFSQAISAYRRGDYDLSCLGLTAMIDRLLSDLSGMITSTSISKRVKDLENKLIISGEEGLDEIELSDYMLIATYTSAIDAFGTTSSFDLNEPDLNRHWIAHGRMNRNMERIDCIRIINLLYGTILIGKMGTIKESGNFKDEEN